MNVDTMNECEIRKRITKHLDTFIVIDKKKRIILDVFQWKNM